MTICTCFLFPVNSTERGADRRSPAPEALGDVGARRRRLVQQPGPANAAPLPEPDARAAEAAAAADTVLSAGTAGAEWRSVEDSRVQMMVSGGTRCGSYSPFR